MTNESTIGQATCFRIGASLKTVQENLSESLANFPRANNIESRSREGTERSVPVNVKKPKLPLH